MTRPPSASPSALDAELTERGWATRPGPAFVMVADLPLAVTGRGSRPAPWSGRTPTRTRHGSPAYHYRGTDTRPPVMRDVLDLGPGPGVHQHQGRVRGARDRPALDRGRLGRPHRGGGGPGTAGGPAWASRSRRRPAPRRPAGASAGCSSRLRRATRAPGRCTSAAGSATRTATTTGWRRPSAFSRSRRQTQSATRRQVPALVLPMPAGYSLRLSSWLPLGPGARLARGAGGRARSTTITTTMSRRT